LNLIRVMPAKGQEFAFYQHIPGQYETAQAIAACG